MLNFHRNDVLTVALVSTLFACSDPDLRAEYPPPPPPSPGSAEELQIGRELPGRLVTALCDYYRRCPVEAQLDAWLAKEIEEPGACEDPARWTWIDVDLRSVLPGIERGITRWNRSAVDAVFANLSSCATKAQNIDVSRLVEGNRPAGAPCGRGPACEPGLECHYPASAAPPTCDGFCVPSRAEPTECSSHSDCGGSEDCVDGMCVLFDVPRTRPRATVVAVGEACDNNDRLPERICGPNAFCLGFNENARCVARASVGASCDQLSCVPEAFCDATKKCVPIVRSERAGEPCGAEGYCVWSAGLTCGYSTRDRSLCASRGQPLGAACGIDLGGNILGACAAPYPCLRNVCSSGMEGSAECGFDAQCQAPLVCSRNGQADARVCSALAQCE